MLSLLNKCLYKRIAAYKASLLYLFFIVAINYAFAYAPMIHIGQAAAPSATLLAGFIYVLRDLAQRQCGHKVWIAMLAGCALSYGLASHETAIASALAFLVGESLDWAVFTFTGWPLSRRILLSSSLSAPIDSLIFLSMIGWLSGPGFALMVLVKLLGVVMLWGVWRYRRTLQHSPN